MDHTVTRVFGKDLDKDFLLIAEIGVNHEGDFEFAKRLISLAHESGADAVKLQSYTPDRYASNFDKERKARVAKFALNQKQHEELFSFAQKIGCQLFSTPLTEDWVETLNPLVSAFKIASGDVTFEPVIRMAAKTGKPVFLSTGTASLDEVKRAVGWFQNEIGGSQALLKEKLILMHCVAAYPVPNDQANLTAIRTLAESFGLKVGYSNHVMGSMACLTAAALGASVFEVHFTDKREGKVFRDHSLSIEPQELKLLKQQLLDVKVSLGTGIKAPMPCEVPMIKTLRKGIIAWRDIQEGDVITQESIAYARPAVECASTDLANILGKRSRKNYVKGDLIEV